MEITVSFKRYTGEGASDQSQTILERLLKKNHDILRAEQHFFDSYMRKAIANVSRDIPIWEKLKETSEWEKIDVIDSPEMFKMDMDKVCKDILNKKERAYLSAQLNGETNKEICIAQNIKHEKQGRRVKNSIVKKLKKWTSREDTLADILWESIDRREKLSNRSVTELRNRFIPLTIEERAENEESIKNKVSPSLPISGEVVAKWERRERSVYIEAPMVSLPQKKPDMVWYCLPIDLDTLPLTYNSRVNERKALLDSMEYARLPDSIPPLKKHGFRDSPQKINQNIDDDYVNIFDEYRYDIRQRYR
jgi:hypothetical protein